MVAEEPLCLFCSRLCIYDSSDSTKSPAWGIATVCEPGHMSQLGRVRKIECG